MQSNFLPLRKACYLSNRCCGVSALGSFSKHERQRRKIAIILCDPRDIFVMISFLWLHCLCLFYLNEKIDLIVYKMSPIFSRRRENGLVEASRTAQLARIIFHTFTLALLFCRGCSRLSYSKTPCLQVQQCSLELILIFQSLSELCFVALFCLAEVTLFSPACSVGYILFSCFFSSEEHQLHQLQLHQLHQFSLGCHNRNTHNIPKVCTFVTLAPYLSVIDTSVI